MKSRIVFLIFLSLLINGCMVISPVTTIPLMTQKNEAKFEGGVTLLPGLTGSITFSPINHISVQFSGYCTGDGSTQSIYYFQGALGCYTKFNSGIILENYYGAGYYYGNPLDGSGLSVQTEYSLYFTQFNFGYQCTPGLLIGLGVKSGYVNADLSDDNSIIINNKRPFIQPQMIIRTGKGNLKFETKFSLAWVNKMYYSKGSIDYVRPVLGIGFTYDLK